MEKKMKKSEKAKVKNLIKLYIMISFIIMIAVITGCPAAATPDPDPVDTSISVSGVSLNKADTTILNGNSEQLTATISPFNATDQSISWTSSDNDVATVTGGLVVGDGDGSATITVTTSDGAFAASCDVTITSVSVAVTGVTLDITSTTINVSETVQLTETITPAGATNQNVTWSSDDEDIATVSTSGLITGVAGGTATITVTSTDGSFTDTCTVTVLEAVSGVTLDITSTTINVSETEQLTETITPAGATNQNVTWASSDETRATVSATGLVTGVEDGFATITVTTVDGGFTASCDVTVVIPVTGVSIELFVVVPNDEVEMNSLFENYYIEFTPWDASNQNYSLSSSAPAVASVDTGYDTWIDITGESIGTSTITVTSEDGGFTDSFILTVIADATDPEVDNTMFFSSTQIILTFYEEVTQATAETLSNYVISDQTGNSAAITSAVLESSTIVYLTLNEILTDGDTFTLTVSNIEDPTGNVCVSTPFSMTYSAPPSPLDVSKIVISGNTISGSADAGDSGTWQAGSPTLWIYAVDSGVLPAQETVLGGAAIMDDGSFAALTNPEMVNVISFSSGDYDLYVINTMTMSWSSAVTVTVP
jgi:uncharacterized protein YjdB